MRRRILAVLLAAASPASALAAPDAETTESLDRRARSLLAEIRETDQRRRVLEEESRVAQAELEATEQASERARNRLRMSERALESAREELALRARGAWRVRGADALAGVAATQSWPELARRQTHLARLVAHASEEARRDARVLDQHAEATRELARSLEELSERGAALARVREAVSEEAARKRELLSEVLDAHERRAEIERRARRSVDSAAARASGGATDAPGTAEVPRERSLVRPVEGEVVLGFGDHRDPTYRVKTRTNGVAFSARAGSPVRAAASGRVAFRDYVDGFGNLLILEHGGDFLTVYGHLAGVERSVGEHVGRGETIGHVGASGVTAEPRLYFELRRGREPLDPRDWWERARSLARDDHR